MWVDRQQRRDCLGNPPKLGMEVLKRTANRETHTARSRVASLCRRGAANRAGCGESFVSCPIPHDTLGGWTQAVVWRESGSFLSLWWSDVAPGSGVSAFLSSSRVFFFFGREAVLV